LLGRFVHGGSFHECEIFAESIRWIRDHILTSQKLGSGQEPLYRSEAGRLPGSCVGGLVRPSPQVNGA
jgi:hypothetical protein